MRALTNALRQQRLHHAYLFTGTRGVGKTTLARIIARALNCENGITDTPCGKCGACSEIEAGRFVDLVELDAASNTQVDNMRELLENALYAPSSGRFKIYIIDEVHMLSRNAFNAMLKTLEEPPPHVKFILATTDPQKIPVTVLSRCLQFNLKQIPRQQIAQRLAHIVEAEQVQADSTALTLIAHAAQGSLRDSLSLLDQAIAHGGGRVDEASTRTMLGTVEQVYLHAILNALAAGNAAEMMTQADRMAERSLSFEAALQELAVLLHRVALAQQAPEMLAEDDPDRNSVLELSSRFAADEVQLYYQIALQGRSDIGLAPDEYAGFTMTLLRMLAFAPGDVAVSETGTPRATARPAAYSAMPENRVAGTVASARSAAASDESWESLVESLNLTGMAKQLAQRCAMTRRDANEIELNLPKADEHILGTHQTKIKAALQQRYGSEIRVTFKIVNAVLDTPKSNTDREREKRQAQAAAEIEKDPFVNDLKENFGGKVKSIQPLQ